MQDMHSLIYGLGIVPVIKLDDAKDATPLAKALMAGGLPLAEVTFRTDAAAESIRAMVRDVPEMLVGAGTVTSIAKAGEARDAGAKFIVTPGFNPEVVGWCVDNKIPVFPGCTTASEVEAAMNLGLTVVKFFPAEQSGGLAKIKALCAPYPSMRFMPTGGISLKNMAEYLAFPKIHACGGSFMVPDDAVKNGRWDEITALTVQAVRAAQGFEIGHAGIYTRDAAEADDAAATFARITGLEIRDPGPSYFVGSGLEIMKSPADFKGHLGYSVINVERSARRQEQLGFVFDEATVRRGANGERTFGYLKGVFHGFTVHLLGR
jgi:2-dehydro-3-deoxyphosphogluconate aldolase/(4S)-4-hydroxy-2-oxoglutarate aldolase